ncbi:MAG: hypothetical protein ACREAM_29220 [Blastocatellia bacterium]
MKTDYCAYPPQIAADIEIAEQRDGDRLAFVISSASVGRYLLLRTAEYRALQLLDANLTPAAVCNEFMRRHGGTLRIPTLTRFLTRLDEIGILAGERVELVIENTDDLLRPGMTAFARIDFGRRMIGAILLRKLKQALRPELWMI